MNIQSSPVEHWHVFEGANLSRCGEIFNAVKLPEWVDIEFILSSNPGLAELLIDNKDLLPQLNEYELIEHIISLSGKQDLLLNKWFDVSQYERMRPDVAQAPVNSTFHYFSANGPNLYPNLNGEDFNITDYVEKKRINAAMSYSFDKKEILDSWSVSNHNPEINSSSEFLDKISQLGKKNLVISLSHDDAFSNPGGIQKIIRQENSDSLLRENICYVHISPVQAVPFSVDFLGKTQIVSRITINGVFAGNYLLGSIFTAILKYYQNDNLYLFIHHFYGFPLGDISYFASNIARHHNAYLWIHDYSSQCDSYTLLRDGIIQCSSPPPDSVECKFCAYGTSRNQHLKHMAKIFNIVNMKYIVPSEAAKDVFFNSHLQPKLQENAFVVPHLSVSDISLEKRVIDPSSKRVRIAYIGYPADHKGWIEFEALTKCKILSKKVEWFHFGKGNTSPVINSEYFNGTQNKDIVQTIRDYGIDFAIIWPLWQETFCFVGYEAALSGCHILTNSHSGNVAHSNLPSKVKTILKILISYIIICSISVVVKHTKLT